ncbi:30S ribosomal protein S11 [Candidatus Pacearchaeota archaeon CG10_big_fil_rev_8_21_14_0_10_31_24]|nr:MAG: 30S ribosomal protein S11 [Candidatus Pacearchaeota archaeon CG10_big_fil_rev_8_21_14_0_10_31_24]
MPKKQEKPTEEKAEEKAEEIVEEISKEESQEKPTEEKAEKPTEEKTSEPVEIKEIKSEKNGIIHIITSQNNTIIHMTDLSGNTISRATGGMVTKHSRLKSDPTIAMFVAKKVAERAKDLGITGLYVRTRSKTGGTSIGSSAHAAIKSLDKDGFKIISVLDTTRVPRGGPKKKGGKRGRRV